VPFSFFAVGSFRVEQREITVGDIVHIRAGERHWHGATAQTPLSHITVTTVGSKSKH
jgi:quercetin dioxygenase-like cupin family protein